MVPSPAPGLPISSANPFQAVARAASELRGGPQQIGGRRMESVR